MQARTSWRTGHSGKGITHSTALFAVVAIAVVMLLPSVSGQLTAKPSASAAAGLASASASTPYVTGTSILKHADSLTLESPGALNIFAMANGGGRPTTGFSFGGLVTAVDHKGYVAAAIAAAQMDSNSYTTKDHYYSIGGVGVSGFQYYGEKTQKLIPPVQPTSTLTEKLVLPESALVVLVALSGGETSIVLKGIPGLIIDSTGTGTNWSARIGQAQLKAGTYTVTETTTNHDAGGTNRADAVGIFAFSNSRSGFIDKGIVQVVANIEAGSDSQGVAYDGRKGEIFVGNYGTDNVSVINDTSNTVVATVAVGTNPSDIAYDWGKGELFVSNTNSGNLSVISDATNTVVATVAVGSIPREIAYDSGKGEVYVANGGSGTVSVINDTTNQVVENITIGPNPFGVAYDSKKGEIFVTWESVSVVNDTSNTVVATLTVSSGDGVTYDSGMNEVFVSNYGADSVSVISDATNSVVATIAGTGYTWDLVYDRGAGEVFVSIFFGSVMVISDVTNSVLANVAGGWTYPWGLAYDSAKGEVFVGNCGCNYGSSDVGVISDGTN